MATKASKVLLMFLPAIMLTAWGVGVLRSDDCYQFVEQHACGCTPQLSCTCVEGNCMGPIRICAMDYALLPVSSGGYALGGSELVHCWRELSCRTGDLKPCREANPCMTGEETGGLVPKFLRPTRGDGCGGGGGDPK